MGVNIAVRDPVDPSWRLTPGLCNMCVICETVWVLGWVGVRVCSVVTHVDGSVLTNTGSWCTW